MKYLVLLLAVSVIPICCAAIYMQTDPQGNVSYSDVPSSNAKVVEAPSVNSSPSFQAPVETSASTSDTTPSSKATSDETGPKKPYTTFMITSPHNQDTIQNQPLIGVDLKVEPSLQPGDKILIFVDGKLTSKPQTTTHFDLANIERGTHQLFAVIMDENEQVVKQSNPVTIFVHRNSLVTSPATAK